MNSVTTTVLTMFMRSSISIVFFLSPGQENMYNRKACNLHMQRTSFCSQTPAQFWRWSYGRGSNPVIPRHVHSVINTLKTIHCRIVTELGFLCCFFTWRVMTQKRCWVCEWSWVKGKVDVCGSFLNRTYIFIGVKWKIEYGRRFLLTEPTL